MKKKKILIIITAIIIDQIIKFIIQKTLSVSGESITILPNILMLDYIGNPGAAFGIFSPRAFLIGLDIMVIFTIFSILFNKKNKLDDNVNLGFSLIAAGGIGNLIDRIFRGYVIDYINIKLFDFPIFNFADICIVIGIALIFILIIINTVKSQENINERV